MSSITSEKVVPLQFNDEFALRPRFSSVWLISVFSLVPFLYEWLCRSVVVGSPAVTDVLPDKLEAVLVPDQGYHQVGPADLCSDMFILSVTVAFATKLEQVRTDVCNAQCF